MQEQFTLIIILHNRHSNLDRLLEFYNSVDFPIVIADSSSEEHVFRNEIRPFVKYAYIPGLSYTQKVEKALKDISTPYVAMCADDDFIIPSGLKECIDFLNGHHDYTAAQGEIIRYYADTVGRKLRFDLLYSGNFTLEDPDPLNRLKKLFNPYKSLLYAVHRTAVLRSAFEGAGKAFNNLYLNEYLTSIIPVLKGKSKDIGSLYQVREYSKLSDDKRVENLDIIMSEKKYKKEFDEFLDYLLSKCTGAGGIDVQTLAEAILGSLKGYALQLESFKKEKISLIKSVGRAVELIPVIGSGLLQNRRYKMSMRSVRTVLSVDDLEKLKKIDLLLKKYR